MRRADVTTQSTEALLDRQDERLRGSAGRGGPLREIFDDLRSGNVSVLPVVIGLIIIAIVFQSLNPLFLSSQNLVNLLLESAALGTIALGVTFVLLLGQIDLSVGSLSGLSAAVLAVLFVRMELPVAIAIGAALALAALIGFLYAAIFNRIGVPSFVITLGGLLAFLGLQLYILGPSGAINLPYDSSLVRFAQLAFVPAWLSYVFVALAGAGLFLSGFGKSRARRAAGLSAASMGALILRSGVGTLLLLAAVWYLNRGRGVGWMFVFFLVLVLVMHYMLRRTRWGRHMFAVGGSKEAARRAGIKVRAIYTSGFVLSATFAAMGGILAASRLAAANQSSGGGDVNLNAIAAAVIGGTSLFGGRGSALGALFGVLVIQAISNGLTLLNLTSSYRFMVTGAVLLLAVALDAMSRRSRADRV